MKIYPAVDIINGEVVRLKKGSPDEITSYRSVGTCLEVALQWEKQGAELLHVVDLDAALGIGDNLPVIHTLLSEVSTPIQFGGGVRDIAKAERLLELGVERVVFGTLAIRKPQAVLSFLREHGFDRMVVSLDYSQGCVMVDGWRYGSSVSPTELLSQYRGEGIGHFLMTSVDTDGLLEGPDMSLSSVCGAKVSDIILAGGVTTLEDIRTLALQGFEAAVVGRALYEGEITLPMAIETGRRCTS